MPPEAEICLWKKLELASNEAAPRINTESQLDTTVFIRHFFFFYVLFTSCFVQLLCVDHVVMLLSRIYE